MPKDMQYLFSYVIDQSLTNHILDRHVFSITFRILIYLFDKEECLIDVNRKTKKFSDQITNIFMTYDTFMSGLQFTSSVIWKLKLIKNFEISSVLFVVN